MFWNQKAVDIVIEMIFGSILILKGELVISRWNWQVHFLNVDDVYLCKATLSSFDWSFDCRNATKWQFLWSIRRRSSRYTIASLQFFMDSIQESMSAPIKGKSRLVISIFMKEKTYQYMSWYISSLLLYDIYLLNL